MLPQIEIPKHALSYMSVAMYQYPRRHSCKLIKLSRKYSKMHYLVYRYGKVYLKCKKACVVDLCPYPPSQMYKNEIFILRRS